MKGLGRVLADNFWQPPRRSWPYPPTELERIAFRLGVSDEDLRQLLRAEVDRRRVAQNGDSPEAPPRHHRHSI
jgi:hypothetical protein